MPDILTTLKHYLDSSRLDEASVFLQHAQLDPACAAAYNLLGLGFMKQGRTNDAVACYRQALALRPDYAEAFENLQEASLESWRVAVRLMPSMAQAHCELADALAAQGKYDEAITSYENALRLQPNYAAAQQNLANTRQTRQNRSADKSPSATSPHRKLADAFNDQAVALAGKGRLEEAIVAYQQALRADPECEIALNNLGITHKDMGNLPEAEAVLRRAIAIKPDFPEAYNNLGLVVEQRRNLDEARTCFEEALRLRPEYADAHNNLGNVLHGQRNLDDAVMHFREAIRLKPAYAEAYHNMASSLMEMGRFDEAVESCQNALRIRPDYADARNNLGNSLLKLGRRDEALTCYDEALRLSPNDPMAHWNRALAWLLLGDYERGWPAYEWRLQGPARLHRTFPQPLWNGSALAGKTILLHTEQGHGDTLQFIRYAPLVKERGGQVILECEPVLAQLLKTCAGIDAVVEQRSPLPPFDVHAPLMSLPAIFRTTMATIPDNVPYLSAEAELVERWGSEISAECQVVSAESRGGHAPLTTHHSPLKVGIVWQGRPTHGQDRHRSIPLTGFAPLVRVNGVHLFSLQKGVGSEQLAGADFPVVDLGEKLDTFADTAALLKNLDLLVTIDTSVAHCAGALGTPVWVLLPFSPDWRWLLDREDSPWYPSMQLFRQKRWGDWAEVIERVVQRLGRKKCRH